MKGHILKWTEFFPIWASDSLVSFPLKSTVSSSATFSLKNSGFSQTVASYPFALSAPSWDEQCSFIQQQTLLCLQQVNYQAYARLLLIGYKEAGTGSVWFTPETAALAWCLAHSWKLGIYQMGNWAPTTCVAQQRHRALPDPRHPQLLRARPLPRPAGEDEGRGGWRKEMWRSLLSNRPEGPK